MARQERYSGPKRIGALWKTQKQGAKSVLNGRLDFDNIGDIRIFITKNTKKGDNPKSPDYWVLAAQLEKEGTGKVANTQDMEDGGDEEYF